MMREALCTAIADEPDMTVVVQAADCTEDLRIPSGGRVDILLVALGDLEHEGKAVLGKLRDAFPDTPILALISNIIPGQEQAALDAGAQAVLTKAAPRRELLCKLRTWQHALLVL